MEWCWPAVEFDEVLVVGMEAVIVEGLPAPSSPSFQDEVRANRAAAAWLKWPLPKLVARRLPPLPPPLNIVENMSWISEEKNIKSNLK